MIFFRLYHKKKLQYFLLKLLLLLFMGICCAFKSSQLISDSILTEDSLIQSQSVHDDKFIYYFRFMNLDNCLSSIIKNPQMYFSRSLELEMYEKQIQQYLRQIDNYDSVIGNKIRRIQRMMDNEENDGLNYLIFQIQKIQLYKLKKIKTNLSINMKNDSSRFFKTQVSINNYKSQNSDILVEWTFLKKKQIIVKIDKKYSCTINLNQVQDHVIKMDYINIRQPQVLEPVGRIFVRIQYIENIETWKLKFKQMLNLKLRQIQILHQTIKNKQDLNNPDLLILTTCQNMESSKLKRSFYQNSFSI